MYLQLRKGNGDSFLRKCFEVHELINKVPIWVLKVSGWGGVFSKLVFSASYLGVCGTLCLLGGGTSGNWKLLPVVECSG